MTRRTFVSTLAIAASATASSAGVKLTSLPPGAVQPEPAVGPDGRLHLVYLRGEPGAADVFYMHGASVDRFSAPMRVNSNASCAVAAGTIRGAHLALGAAGRPHVVWNGSGQALPAPPVPPGVDPATVKHRSPLLYSRLGEGGKAFEPQRNLMTRSYTLDGGGSVAADAEGHVYAGWHAHVGGEPKGEEGRRVWLARSNDSGASFSDETAVFGENQGACACCGLRFFAAADGTVYGAYRSARATVHRDLFLLRSTDQGRTFTGREVQQWEIGACPMSSMSFAERDGRVWVAWKTDGQVWFARADQPSTPMAAPGPASRRKHPRLAFDSAGRMLLAWTSVPGWAKPGELGWALYQPTGKLDATGGGEPTPVWSFAAPVATADGFALLV